MLCCCRWACGPCEQCAALSTSPQKVWLSASLRSVAPMRWAQQWTANTPSSPVGRRATARRANPCRCSERAQTLRSQIARHACLRSSQGARAAHGRSRQAVKGGVGPTGQDAVPFDPPLRYCDDTMLRHRNIARISPREPMTGVLSELARARARIRCRCPSERPPGRPLDAPASPALEFRGGMRRS